MRGVWTIRGFDDPWWFFVKLLVYSSVGMRFVKNCHALLVEVDYIPWLFWGRSIRDSRHNLYRKKIKKTHYYPPKRTKKSHSGECLLFSRCLMLGFSCIVSTCHVFFASLLRYTAMLGCHAKKPWQCSVWVVLRRQYLVWNALASGTFWVIPFQWWVENPQISSPLKNRVFHYIHHPFWGVSPYSWKHPSHPRLHQEKKHPGCFLFSLGKLIFLQENQISSMSWGYPPTH